MSANNSDKTSYIPNRVVSRGENDTGIVIYDPENPRSVYSLLPPQLQQAVEAVNPEFFKYTEKALQKALMKRDLLDERDYRLRISFWNEYYKVQDGFKNVMSMKNVCAGVCPMKYFYEDVITNPRKMAWILYPLVDYQLAMEEMLDYGIREMRKILVAPLMKKVVTERINNKTKETTKIEEEVMDIMLVREKIKIFALLDNRVKGAVTQTVKVHGRMENFHAHAQLPMDYTKNFEAPKSLEMIDKEMRKIQREQKVSPVLHQEMRPRLGEDNRREYLEEAPDFSQKTTIEQPVFNHTLPVDDLDKEIFAELGEPHAGSIEGLGEDNYDE